MNRRHALQRVSALSLAALTRSLGVLSTAAYLGFTAAPDPNGRRIRTTRFSNPVPPEQVGTAKGRSQTVLLDELGRERRIEVTLGPDYGNALLVVGASQYDDAGRVAFRADPYVNYQDPATAYGTTNYYTATGDLGCTVCGCREIGRAHV